MPNKENHISDKAYDKQLYELQVELVKFQRYLIARGQKLAVVLEPFHKRRAVLLFRISSRTTLIENHSEQAVCFGILWMSREDLARRRFRLL